MSVKDENTTDHASREQGENLQDEGKNSIEQNSIKWRIRPMCLSDIDKCLDIWRQVELTEAHHTVSSSLITDPHGFYVAELESDGQLIGMCSGVMARPDTAFMGFYAVDPLYQGIGVGRALWAKTIERLDETVNVGLYGVPAMSEKYKKSGFKLEDTIRMLIFESKPGQAVHLELLQDLDQDSSSSLKLEQINGETDEVLLNKLIEFDKAVNHSDRDELLRNYLTSKSHDRGVPLTLALVRRRCATCSCDANLKEISSGKDNGKSLSSPLYYDEGRHDEEQEEALSRQVHDSLSISTTPNMNSSNTAFESLPETDFRSGEDEEANSAGLEGIELLGYGCIRDDNTDGGMIGPLYANTSDICEIILKNLLQRFHLKPGGKYSVMSLTSNQQAANILCKIGFEEMDQCTRMFTRFIPQASTDKIFFIHSPNFTLF